MIIDSAHYKDGAREHEEALTPEEAAARLKRGIPDEFVWIGIHEPESGDMERLAKLFGLHELAVEDAQKAHQRPKIEDYDRDFFIVLRTAHYHEDREDVHFGEIHVFAGASYVITVRHGEHGGLTELRTRLEDQPDLLCLGPSAVLYAVADLVVDNFVEVATAVEEDVEELEAAVFSPKAQRTGDIERLYQLKRELMALRRAVAPLEVPLVKLTERPIDVIPEAMRSYFRDVLDHTLRVRDQVGTLDELLSSILQSSLARTSLADNEDTRKISAWAAMIAVPTLITGLYGMNFRYMPELNWRWGYPAVLVLIVTVCLLLYRGFKNNNWL